MTAGNALDPSILFLTWRMQPEDIADGRDPLPDRHIGDPDIEPGILSEPGDGSIIFGRHLCTCDDISDAHLPGTVAAPIVAHTSRATALQTRMRPDTERMRRAIAREEMTAGVGGIYFTIAIMRVWTHWGEVNL